MPPGTPMPNLDSRETVVLRPTTPTEEDLAMIGGYAAMTDHQVIVIHLPPGYELHHLTALHVDPTADHMY